MSSTLKKLWTYYCNDLLCYYHYYYFFIIYYYYYLLNYYYLNNYFIIIIIRRNFCMLTGVAIMITATVQELWFSEYCQAV